MLSTTTHEAHAKRWRQWQLANEHDERKGARRARIMFTAIFLAVGVWLGVQVFYSATL